MKHSNKFLAGEPLPADLYEPGGLVPIFGTDVLLETDDEDASYRKLSPAVAGSDQTLVIISGPGGCSLRDGLVFDCSDGSTAILATITAYVTAQNPTILIPPHYPAYKLSGNIRIDEHGWKYTDAAKSVAAWGIKSGKGK